MHNYFEVMYLPKSVEERFIDSAFWIVVSLVIFSFCRFKEIIEKSKDTLISLGCPSFTLMDFHDTVSCLICGS